MSVKLLYRPHKFPWFGTMVRNFVLRRPQARKYAHFIDGKTFFLIKLFPFRLSNIGPQFREIVELLLWCAINRMSPFRAKFSVGSCDTLIIFGHRVLATEILNQEAWERIEDEVEYLRNLNCEKVVHLTHFSYGLTKFIENVHRIRTNVLIGEGNPVKVNEKIKEELGAIEFQLVPFQSDKRFKVIKPFEERFSRAVSTGTIAPRILSSDFHDCFGTDCLQPSRLEIYHFIDKNPSVPCDIFVENRYDPGASIKREYYSQDLVSLYNDYKYYLVTSEVIGFPQIAMYEAVACGCVLVSRDEDLLAQFGLIANEHYIFIDSFEALSDVMSNRDHANDLEMNRKCRDAFETQSSKSSWASK